MAGILVGPLEFVSLDTDVYLDKVKNHEVDKWYMFSHFPAEKQVPLKAHFPNLIWKTLLHVYLFSLVFWCHHKDLSIWSKQINIFSFAKLTWKQLISPSSSWQSSAETDSHPTHKYIKPHGFLESMSLRNEGVCNVAIEMERAVMESMTVQAESKWKIISAPHTYEQHIAHKSVWMLLSRGRKYIATGRHWEKITDDAWKCYVWT